ncbi:OB-fold protein [Polaribacter porphyrae]|uniref:tRNA_anti-like n=1 Tax=Polaribacter porphyrae TaxID=1137780 RepID=A0A2S7WLB4_9FLAO|nr:OB-fold nucleic acid binding domain-containing protein [Polaribacter porphyrae]PQJ78363.1 hypothetical protein BTO18_03780 [Polaribacter porphyrae]
MNKKKIIVVLLILGMLGGVVGYKMYNKPHVNVNDTKADFSVNANAFLNEFSTDETKANTKYLEKIVSVKGIISSIKVENNKGIISLKTDDDFGSIQCHLSDEATKSINNLKEGQNITVKGICTGYLMDVILVKSEIIN